MAFYFIKDTTLTDIADAIREKSDTTEKLNAGNFAEAIRAIEGGTYIIQEGEYITGNEFAVNFPANTYCILWRNIEDEKLGYHILSLEKAPTTSIRVNAPIVGTDIIFMNASETYEKKNVTIDGDAEVIYNSSYGVIVRFTGTSGGTITIE